ncbi:Glutathione-regulated potassium-efflux system ancillary protein KefF [Pseudomonas orientalis]|nr:Glutathione-regulated potassium-efflux system ancillary protein KefF [Pseudomonas orientalis]
MILIIFAHPYPDKSKVNQLMLKLAANNPDVTIRSLYDLYPDFNIDVEAEQKAVEQAQLLVLQHPLYWYSYPPLLSCGSTRSSPKAGPMARALPG